MEIEQHFYITHGSKKKSQEKLKNAMNLNEIEYTTYQNLWHNESSDLIREKFIALSACIRKEEIHKINNLSFHFRKVGNKKSNLK